jgi:hypothetical protein
LSEFSINNTGSGGPFSITNVGSEFIIAWTESRIITCARFSGAGLKMGDSFTVNDQNTPGTWPLMAHVPGGFVVLWVSGGNLLLQPFTSDGTKNGNVLRVSTGVDAGHPPAIARQLDGTLVVVWGDAGQANIFGQVFNSDLSKLSHIFTVNDASTTSTAVNLQPAITYLDVSETGNGFVVAWNSGPGVSQTLPRFRYYQPDGSRAKETDAMVPQIHMAKFEIELRPGALAPLPHGGFCGLFLGGGGPVGENVLMIDSYGPDGTHLIAANVTHRDDHSLSALPVMTATPNNDALVVVWVQQSPHVAGVQGANIMAAMASSDLQVVPGIKINTAPPRGQSLPCVTPVATDTTSNIAFVWSDQSLSTPPQSPSLKARIFLGDLSRDVGPA